MTETNHKRKLIEVALPLDEINAACKADKDRKTGTIRNLHKWFAPMPLPAWRALLFAALVDDPEDDNKRVYLLDLIKRLVASGADLPDDEVLVEARALLAQQFPAGVPTVMDPFCGGGTTLVEAQRLGLPSYGSDLNPVPALITRALTEVLPKVFGGQPLHPIPWTEKRGGRNHAMREGRQATLGVVEPPVRFGGYDGLVRDVEHYARAIQVKAWAELEQHYPTQPGERIIAWLWARSAPCPNPTCGIETPLTTSWWLSKKRQEFAWIEPRVEAGTVSFDVVSGRKTGEAPAAPKVGRGASFACVKCGSVLTEEHLQEQAKTGLGQRLTAIAYQDSNGHRRYRAARAGEEEAALAVPVDRTGLEIPLADDPRSIWCVNYGITTQADLYTSRQLLTLTRISDLVAETHAEILADGGSSEWAVAVVTLLGLAVGRLAMSNSTQARVTIRNDGTTTRFNAAFGRNDLPMTWDFPEMNALGDEGTWVTSLPTVLDSLAFAVPGSGLVQRADARIATAPASALVATDPPYFDAIGYADLSDYFYVWHRRSLRHVHPDLYTTLAAPKTGELTAISSHHGNNKNAARAYFIDGFTDAFRNLQRSLGPSLPMLVVYASKEQKAGRDEETRWSSILTAMLNAELEITGTWPIHGTGSTRMVGQGTNAIASYIVMVCRPRPDGATTVSLADFNRALRRELPEAIRNLQAASILPVDLAQAVMGPGMQIYSRYRIVLDQSGERVPVEQALRLINAAREAVLDEQEGELDPESRFAVRWWETYGWQPSVFDEAAKTARPLGISVDDVARAQVATSKGNKVQLLGSGDLDHAWVPSADIRPTAWEAVHHLAHRLIDGGGELDAARLMAVLGSLRDPAMALTYRLHNIAAHKGRTTDQERYNALINSWAELVKLSADDTTMPEGLF